MAEPSHAVRPWESPLGVRAEADVVSLARVVADRLLEGKVLLATKEVLATDRRGVVGAFQHARLGDFETTPERERVGGVPVCLHHGPLEAFLRPDQLDVERVRRNARACVGDARNVLQLWMPRRVPLPAIRRDKISRCGVNQRDSAENCGVPSPPLAGLRSDIDRHRGRSEISARFRIWSSETCPGNRLPTAGRLPIH